MPCLFIYIFNLSTSIGCGEVNSFWNGPNTNIPGYTSADRGTDGEKPEIIVSIIIVLCKYQLVILLVSLLLYKSLVLVIRVFTNSDIFFFFN